MKRRKLTAKQVRFVDAYIVSGNATDAAIKAGYSKRTARSVGAENLTKPDIQKIIFERQKKASSKADVSLEWWLKKVKAIAETGKGDNTKVKALDLIGKHLGAYVNELSIIQKLPDDELDNIVNKLMAKM